MNRRTHRSPILATAAGAALLLAGCTGTGGSTKGADAKAPDDPSKVSGTITVLTQRTDLVQDGTMKKYAAEFNRTYPKVKGEFQALTNYEAEIKIRMNTDDYGDVLLIPAVIKKNDYPKFFASLGTAARVLEVSAAVLLVAGAVALPLGLVALLVWLAARQATHRRRERALDAV